MRIIKPQDGFQTKALSSRADIAIMGGAAGCGKTFVLLLDALRKVDVKNYGASIFRRTSPQIRNAGGLIDTSRDIYQGIGGKLAEQSMKWTFPSNATISFDHLQYDKDCHNHQGAQYGFIGFDELTHFSEYQFWYMLSRNRSNYVLPTVRATCNPDPTSFVKNIIEWWIDEATGFPIPERSGVIRYFIKLNDNLVWGESKEAVYDQIKDVDAFKNVEAEAKKVGNDWRTLIKSFTFIPGSIYENSELMKNNPEYLANLLSLNETEQNQLLRGNWKYTVDGLNICKWEFIDCIFDNYPQISPDRFITCDAAGYGRDLCVIFVWRGWEVVEISVISKTSPHEITTEIEHLRRKYGIMRLRCLVDQDGVGGGTVKQGGYLGFHGGGAALFNLSNRGKENYVNLKAQCVYKCAEENINVGNIKIQVNNQNCKVDGMWSHMIKIGGKLRDIRDLIKEDLRAWRRSPRDDMQRLAINSKDEQKIILSGRSPDFGDNILMRKYFDIRLIGGGLSY
jgi:hypothetical protein